MIKNSIIIPTYNHLEDNLIPCLNSIIEYTDLNDTEIVIVANGCKDRTKEYLDNQKIKNIKVLWYDDPLGYTKATNEGIKQSNGNYIILLNNDTILRNQEKNQWINILKKPFLENDKVGVTGPLASRCPIINRKFLLFFCVMIEKNIFDEIGLLDEIFNPGFAEDMDFCIRAENKGYKLIQVPLDDINCRDFPIYHKAEGTVFDLKDWDKITERNLQILFKKHGKKVYIITPTYKRYLKLRKTLDSINKQKYRNIISYICADGYDEKVKHIIDEFNKKSDIEFQYHYLDKHEGAFGSKCRQKILEIIPENGFVCFVDDDNTVNENYVGELLSQIINEKDYKISYCQIEHVELGKIIPSSSHNEGEFVFGDIDSLNFMVDSSLAKKFSYKWEHDIKSNFVDHDYQFIKECSKNTKSKYVKKILGTHGDKGIVNMTEKDDLGVFNNLNLDLSFIEKLKAQDSYVFDEFKNNLYSLNKEDVFEKNVLDIGAYNGIFSILCAEYGSNKIVSIEPNIESFKLFLQNTKKYNNIIPINVAVTDKSKNIVYLEEIEKNTMVSEDNVDINNINNEKKLSYTITLEDILNIYFRNDNDIILKIDCEGFEFPILMSCDEKMIKRFKKIFIEIHGTPITKYEINYLYDYIMSLGYKEIWNVSFYTKQKNEKGEEETIYNNNKVFKFERKDDIKNIQLITNNADVTAMISTKNRYNTTLPLAITSIANQTVKPKELIIFDDGDQEDLRKNPLYENIFKYLDLNGIEWRVIFGEKKGQVLNHQKSIEISKHKYIWRLDDDNLAESNVLEKLLLEMKDDVGAVAGLVLDPLQNIRIPENFTYNNINDLSIFPNCQWVKHEGKHEVDHLYSTFLYRKEASKHGYCLKLSPVGHREETIFTYEMKRSGWKLIVDSSIITWHFRESGGGIRSYRDKSLWDHDENVFNMKMKVWNKYPGKTKLILVTGGLGDNFAFIHAYKDIIKEHPDVIVSSFYEDVYKFSGINYINIDEALYLTNNTEKYNIYRYMEYSKVKKNLVESYKDFFINFEY